MPAKSIVYKCSDCYFGVTGKDGNLMCHYNPPFPFVVPTQGMAGQVTFGAISAYPALASDEVGCNNFMDRRIALG